MPLAECCAIPQQPLAPVALRESDPACCGSSWSDATAQANIKDVVRDKYSRIAAGDDQCGCSMIGDAYSSVEGYVEEADLGLGCGLPVDHAGLRKGQAVVDLGSGAGLDAFVARRIVGPSGQVTGIDFSGAMVRNARQNAAKLGFDNVHFVLGDIEQMPLADASADVVISNCVLNLVPRKEAAFDEVWRVLRPGGHFAISDVVLARALPEAVRQSVVSYVGCVAGAMLRDAYLRLIAEAGFEEVRVMTEREIAGADGALSITVRGVKPQGALA